MIKNDSRLKIVEAHIKKLECVVTADSNEGSALLQQLRILREDIKNKAKKDYVEVQANVMNSFRTLMEQLATLSFFASEADEDNREIEKAIVQMNKIKSTISENILGLKEEGEKTTASVDDEDEELKKFIESNNGKYFSNYSEWYSECLSRNLKLEIDGATVEAYNDLGDCLGKYATDEMQGCLFENVDDYDKAFESDEEEEEEDLDD